MRDDRTALVRDDGETWSLVQDASGTGLLLAGAVLALAALLTVPILDGAPYFAALQVRRRTRHRAGRGDRDADVERVHGCARGGEARRRRTAGGARGRRGDDAG